MSHQIGSSNSSDTHGKWDFELKEQYVWIVLITQDEEDEGMLGENVSLKNSDHSS